MVIVISVVIMIVVIPIAFRVPAAIVFIPPSVDAVPAALPRCAQFPARVFGLPATEAMPCHGLVQPVVRAHNAALAIVFVGAQKRNRSEH